MMGTGELNKENYLTDCANAVVYVQESAAKIAALESDLAEAGKRLAEEIKWGHRNCKPDNCLSSGIDCPAAPEENKEEA
jgi:hypothetical protein